MLISWRSQPQRLRFPFIVSATPTPLLRTITPEEPLLSPFSDSRCRIRKTLRAILRSSLLRCRILWAQCDDQWCGPEDSCMFWSFRCDLRWSLAISAWIALLRRTCGIRSRRGVAWGAKLLAFCSCPDCVLPGWILADWLGCGSLCRRIRSCWRLVLQARLNEWTDTWYPSGRPRR